MILSVKRSLVFLPWALCLVLAGAVGWRTRELSASDQRLDSLGVQVDSMSARLDEAKLTEFQLERKRAAAEKMLGDLTAGREDLQRMYEKEKAASDEAIAAEAEAMRQGMAKEAALQGERTARDAETQQRRLAEARADSINQQQRLTAQANVRLQASKVAQNSMAVKGDQRIRALMAVQAWRSMEAAGGDVNKEEIVRALQGALDELERTAQPGIASLSAGPRGMAWLGTELLVIGNDGSINAIDPAAWRKRNILDLSTYSGKTGGRAFLGEGSVMLTNSDRAIALCSSGDGTLIAKETRTPHEEDIISMAAFGDQGLVTGDRNGHVIVWSVDGDRLRIVKEHVVGGNVRAMVSDAKSRTVVAVNGTERVFILSSDGSIQTLALADADRAHCLAVGRPGEVLIGSHQGSIWAVRPQERELRRLHAGSGQRVEVIAVEAGEGRHVAFVDLVRGLRVFDRTETGRSPFQMMLTGTPNVMAFGAGSVLYLGYEDRTIRRVFTETGAMAQRVCALAGRPWTREEWARHIGEGEPATTCVILP